MSARSATPPATEIPPPSLHDALPISDLICRGISSSITTQGSSSCVASSPPALFSCWPRSEEHTSELQSRRDLVCRLLLEKKNAAPVRLTRLPAAAAATRRVEVAAGAR